MNFLLEPYIQDFFVVRIYLKLKENLSEVFSFLLDFCPNGILGRI